MPFPRRKPVPQQTEELPRVETPEEKLHRHRASLYLEYGFSQAAADELASARDHAGVFVHHALVKRVLDQGANHAQAVAIFT